MNSEKLLVWSTDNFQKCQPHQNAHC